MVNSVIDDQYTAARAYFGSVIGLLVIESLIRLPGYLYLKYHKGRPKSWSKASHWKSTVLLHRLLSLPSPVPFLIDYHVPNVLRFLVFAGLNVLFGLNHNIYTTDYKLYGWLTIANAGLALLLPSRTNLFSLVLRIPSPVLLQYHRWIGIAAVAHATTHFAYNIRHYIQTDQVASSFANTRIRIGIMSWLSLALIFLTALPIVRRKKFEVFYYTHALFFVFMVGALIHTTNGPEFLLPGFFLWVADRAIRFAYNFRRVEVQSVAHFDGGVTKFEVRGKMLMTSHPGQIVWLQLPNVSFLNWHPFTVAGTADKDGNVATIAVRGLGGYTRNVQNVDDSAKTSLDGAVSEASISPGRMVRMRLDGPYGIGRIQWGAWPVNVLVAGGIGITPGISIASHLIRQALALSAAANANDYQVLHIHLLWVVKDASHIQWFDQELRQLSALASSEDVPVTLDITVHTTRGASMSNGAPQTQESIASSEAKETSCPWTVQTGRPNIHAWCEEIKNMRSGLDAAVNVCGPRSLIDETRKAAVKSSWEKGLFHVEEEVFEF